MAANPAATALLVVDMQNQFAGLIEESLPKVLQLIGFFRKSGLPVVFTQHGHTDEELAETVPDNQLVRRWGADGSIRYGSKAWEFLPAIADSVKKDDFVTPKNSYDAFLGTDYGRGPSRLDRILREELGVKRVLVCGVMTDCCCDTTARGAFNRGYDTWLISDACATADDTRHRRGLESFGQAFGPVMDCSTAISRLVRLSGP